MKDIVEHIGGRRRTAEVGCVDAIAQRGVDSSVKPVGARRLMEVVKHERRRADGRERIGDAVARDVGRRAMYRL